MSETSVNRQERTFRHRDRISQIPIYLGKQFRFFINESDWKVLPMAAVIAILVAVVVRTRLFASMEGCLISSFALACVALWNGCFNSIQAISRERAIVKREHRSGMHITAYVASHMIYQFVLCLAQTVISLFVLKQFGVPFPEEGILLRKGWELEFGITMLLISYAADMMSLFISSIARTTTAAMTVMPFVLIFQLVFSGGIIPIPAAIQPLSNLTISNYGIKAVTSQCGYNELPMAAGWTAVDSMKDSEIHKEVTVGQILEILNKDAMKKYRDQPVIEPVTAAQVAEFLNLGEVKDKEALIIPETVTLGQLIDFANSSELIRKQKDRKIPIDTTIGEVLELVGEQNVKVYIQQKTAEAGRKDQYESTVGNLVINWGCLGLFIVLFALLSIISLELIDKDKR